MISILPNGKESGKEDFYNLRLKVPLYAVLRNILF